MSDKFQDKYRIPLTRWQNWDYGWNSAYFITICTAGWDCVFGKIVNGKMVLSDLGILADKFWHEIPKHFPYAELGGITGNKNPMINDNLSKIARWYKGRVSFESRKIHPDFDWQPRFHDHVIRNDGAYQRIAEYILNNPANWQEDQFYMG